MIKNFLLFLFTITCFISHTPANADNIDFGPGFKTTEEILMGYNQQHTTECSSAIFAQSLYDHSSEVTEYDDEDYVRMWAKNTMQSPDVLEQILQCPEITSIPETETIVFSPIVYNFPSNERSITINYSTTPKILRQLLVLSSKRSLPNGNPNPKLNDVDDPAIYINTDPAWYAIMVVQHGSLSHFVGKDKNNIVSMQYINDNIDKLYPIGYNCTSRSAWANNSDTINQVVHEVVDLEKDTNDYYVAGDINLEWVMYAEIVADIVITVATMGIGEAGIIAAKTGRATKAARGLMKSVKSLSKVDKVKDYTQITRQIAQHSDDIAKLEKNIKNAERYERTLRNMEKAQRSGRNVAKYEKEAKEILEASQKIDPKMTSDALKNADKLRDQQKTLQESIKPLQNKVDDLVKTNKDVATYKQQTETLTDLMKYRRDLTAFRRPQTGNIFSRSFKTLRAASKSSKTLNKSTKAARATMSSFSSKAKDALYHATRKHGARLMRFERDAGFIYGALNFLGDMYDKTSTTSKEYSNGMEFKPFCLLSADDLEGQENVVNYGMWLMWTGNSTDPGDDDAAFLQATDFAEKFFYKLDEFQDEHGAQCNVDIYVVRPIIRLDETTPDNPQGELFYLFMNDTPWSTSNQFDTQHPDPAQWNAEQAELETNDPHNKYNRQPATEENESVSTEQTTEESVPVSTEQQITESSTPTQE